MGRTAEEKIKFDSGLTIGRHLVVLRKKGVERVGLVEISKRGAVYLMLKPDQGDMYSGWQRLQGNALSPSGQVVVWAARNPELMKVFDAEPSCSVSLD